VVGVGMRVHHVGYRAWHSVRAGDGLDLGARHRLHFLPEQRYWLLEELESLLEEAALASPLLVCIDDMHWADVGSLTALRTLPPRLAHLPIMWLVSFREGEARAELRAAIESLDEIGAQSLLLGPLDGDAVGQVAGDLLGAEPDPGLLDLAGRAHGSPFLLVELLRGLQEDALVRTDSGHATLVEARLPAGSPTACETGCPGCPSPRGRPRWWHPCWGGASPSATCRRC